MFSVDCVGDFIDLITATSLLRFNIMITNPAATLSRSSKNLFLASVADTLIMFIPDYNDI